MTEINFIPSKDELDAQTNRISKRSSIGRSKNYLKLLEYLLKKELETIENKNNEPKTLKETEIAIDVFGKSTDFNPGDDATVRVHISNLRKKLEAYYQDESEEERFFITIPTGGYRVVFTLNPENTSKIPTSEVKKVDENDTKTQQSNKKSTTYKALIALIILSVIIHVSLYVSKIQEAQVAVVKVEEPPYLKARAHPIWNPLPELNQLVTIAIGEPDILHRLQPSETLDNTNKYISRGKAIALKNMLALFNTPHKVRFKMAEELTPDDIRHTNIIYIGNFETMGILSNYFNGSNFTFNKDTLTLQDKTSTTSYQPPSDIHNQYVDYALFAKIDGPRKNKIYIISGFTDSSILQLSWKFSRHDRLNSSNFMNAMKENELTSFNNFELLYKVQSLNGVDLNSQLVTGNNVDSKAIWN